MNTENPNNPWNSEQESILKLHYPNVNNAEIARKVGRTISAVKHKAYKLGLEKSEAFMKSDLSGKFQPKPEPVKVKFFKRIYNWLIS